MQIGLPFTDDEPIAPLAPLAPIAPLAPLAPTPVRPIAPSGVGDLAAIYFVRHRRARRYLLRLDAEGRVRVTIPRGGSRREAIEFAQANQGWIARQRAKVSERVLVPEEQRAMRVLAAAVLPPRLTALASQHGLRISRVTIRDQRTRWGSCGRDGHICLNWRLMLMPGWVRDYVLIHELMHLRRLDHSPAYWRLVAAACPDYQAARRWLRLNGPGLR